MGAISSAMAAATADSAVSHLRRYVPGAVPQEDAAVPSWGSDIELASRFHRCSVAFLPWSERLRGLHAHTRASRKVLWNAVRRFHAWATAESAYLPARPSA